MSDGSADEFVYLCAECGAEIKGRNNYRKHLFNHLYDNEEEQAFADFPDFDQDEANDEQEASSERFGSHIVLKNITSKRCGIVRSNYPYDKKEWVHKYGPSTLKRCDTFLDSWCRHSSGAPKKC